MGAKILRLTFRARMYAGESWVGYRQRIACIFAHQVEVDGSADDGFVLSWDGDPRRGGGAGARGA